MEQEELIKQILDDSQQIVHISDFETLSVIYANKAAQKFTQRENESYEGKTCYQYLMGLESPCQFCPKEKLQTQSTCQCQSTVNQRELSLKTKLIDWDGKKAIVEYAQSVPKSFNSEKLKAQIQKSSSLNLLLQKDLKIISALSSSYLNVYLIDVDTKTIEIVKLDGYVTKGFDKNTSSQFPYDAACHNYISARVFKDDVKLVEYSMKWEVMLQAVRENPYYEFTYRVLENNKIHYYQGRYRLVEEKYIVCGFQNIDNLFEKEQAQKLALQEAKNLAEKHSQELLKQLAIVKTISKTFNAIYYIDLRDYSFVDLGTNLQGVQEIIGVKGDARSSFELMYKHLVLPEFVDEIREFTNLENINERLKNRTWISKQFYGPIGGWSDGIFIAGNRDANGNFDHVIWATRDIDEDKRKEIAFQKQLEKAIAAAQSANAAKTDFLFNMSHDIRTPMNAIIGYTDLLEKEQDNPQKFKDYLSKIRLSNNFLLSLINNVLEMATIDRGKTTLSEIPYSTLDIRNEVITVYDELMKEKKIEFSESSNIKTQYIYYDKVKLSEIFMNLISNAYKYTPTGGKITMKLEELPHEKQGYIYIRSTISDTGIGMSKEYLPLLFDEFSRERNATEAGIKGTGLGMSIVKKFIELMNGKIEVSSELGKGTTYVITIPHRIALAPQNNNSSIDNNILKKIAGKRILLAEDNDFNAEIAIELLQELKLQVDLAKDGLICVDMITQAPENYYDIILMDVQMPKMNGYEATEKIRNLCSPIKSKIPIIALTANAFDEDRQNAFTAGMNEHISKPININELARTISSFF